MTIRAGMATAAALVIGWIGLLAAVMFFSDGAPQAFVVFADGRFLAQLPEGAAIVDMGRHWAIIAAGPQGLAGSLYAAGAWVVLPAGLRGCAG